MCVVTCNLIKSSAKSVPGVNEHVENTWFKQAAVFFVTVFHVALNLLAKTFFIGEIMQLIILAISLFAINKIRGLITFY